MRKTHHFEHHFMTKRANQLIQLELFFQFWCSSASRWRPSCPSGSSSSSSPSNGRWNWAKKKVGNWTGSSGRRWSSFPLHWDASKKKLKKYSSFRSRPFSGNFETSRCRRRRPAAWTPPPPTGTTGIDWQDSFFNQKYHCTDGLQFDQIWLYQTRKFVVILYLTAFYAGLNKP